MYPAMKPKRMIGTEPIVSPDGHTVGRMLDFWQWAYSDLVGNAERGALAEYLVACALGINGNERISWDKYDLLSTDGVAIEVKTSGYLQTWEQKNLSKLVFGIHETYGWNSQTNTYERTQKRQADIYVFCVHKHKDQQTVDPLQIAQWDFYLMPTAQINEKFGAQKTVFLSSLINAGAELCQYDRLCARIHELMQPAGG